jgi:hypothetical protein
VLDDEGGALEEKDGRVIRALGFDVQSLIDTQEDIKVCSLCHLSCLFSHFCLHKLQFQFK